MFQSSIFERVWIFLAIVLLPFQDTLEVFSGVSLVWCLYLVGLLYVLAMRHREFLGMLWHPVFVSGYVFLSIAFLIEATRPMADFNQIFQSLQMLFGAALIATILRDSEIFKVSLWGFFVLGLGLAIFYIVASYAIVAATQVLSAYEASDVRADAIRALGISLDVNAIAIQMTQAILVGIILLARIVKTPLFRFFIFVAIGVGVVGLALPMSRTAFLTLVLCGLVLTREMKLLKFQLLPAVIVLALGVFIYTPETAMTRLTSLNSEETTNVNVEQKDDSRVRVLKAAFDNLPSIWALGVGSGNFWKDWGQRSEFSLMMNSGTVAVGAHNSIVQVLVYWGILALIAYLFFLFRVYQYIPPKDSDSIEVNFVRMVVLTSLFLVLFRHELHLKQYSICLGLLIGHGKWLSPKHS